MFCIFPSIRCHNATVRYCTNTVTFDVRTMRCTGDAQWLSRQSRPRPCPSSVPTSYPPPHLVAAPTSTVRTPPSAGRADRGRRPRARRPRASTSHTSTPGVDLAHVNRADNGNNNSIVMVATTKLHNDNNNNNKNDKYKQKQ